MGELIEAQKAKQKREREEQYCTAIAAMTHLRVDGCIEGGETRNKMLRHLIAQVYLLGELELGHKPQASE